MTDRKALAAIILSTLAGVATASNPRALLTTQTGNPLTLIPGTGVPVSSFTQAQIGLSPRGTHWTLAVNATGQPTTSDTYLLGGTASGISAVVPEGSVMGGTGLVFTGRPQAQVAVNDQGDLAFKVTLDAPFAVNEAVMRYNAGSGSFDVIAREGGAIPGVSGESYGGILDSTSILNDGRVVFRAQSTSGGLPSTQDDFLFASGTPQTTLVQSGFLTPTNQAGGGTASLTSLNDEAYVDAAAGRWLVDGALSSGTRVLVVDQRVVMQQGVPITGLGGELPTSSLVDEARMFAGGDWAAWGVGAGGIAFALVNDALYAKEGDSVPGGLVGETIVSFGYMHINGNGDIAYAARTSAQRDVIIVDGVGLAPYIAVATSAGPGTGVSGTLVDYNGDGIVDPASFTFLNDDTVALSDAGELYFVGRVTSTITQLNLGDGLFVMQTAIPAPGAAGLAGALLLAAARRRR